VKPALHYKRKLDMNTNIPHQVPMIAMVIVNAIIAVKRAEHFAAQGRLPAPKR
jgi:hypothetical protein